MERRREGQGQASEVIEAREILAMDVQRGPEMSEIERLVDLALCGDAERSGDDRGVEMIRLVEPQVEQRAALKSHLKGLAVQRTVALHAQRLEVRMRDTLVRHHCALECQLADGVREVEGSALHREQPDRG